MSSQVYFKPRKIDRSRVKVKPKTLLVDIIMEGSIPEGTRQFFIVDVTSIWCESCPLIAKYDFYEPSMFTDKILSYAKRRGFNGVDVKYYY